MVFATAAESGGALQNVKELYRYAKEDSHNKWIFVTSVVDLPETSNITNIKVLSLKKSWVKRLYFDLFQYKKIVRDNNPDEVHNLQTFFYRDKRIRYIFYATNALFFTPIKFKASDDFNLFLRQKLLTGIEYSSCRKSDLIYTECNWMAVRISNDLHIDKKKIKVREHTVQINKEAGDRLYLKKQFFYPSSAFIYKNHQTLVEAAKIIKQWGYDFKLILTLKGDETGKICELKKECNKYSIKTDWLGTLDIKQMKKMYLSSVLVFPSYLETIGLPLLEAREMGTPIICSNLPYATSIIGDYEKACFFKYDDPVELAELMKNFLDEIEQSERSKEE